MTQEVLQEPKYLCSAPLVGSGLQPRAQVWIELLGFADHPRVCSGCQRQVRGIHDWSQREIRDLPVFDADTVLVVWRAQVACPACGPKLEALEPVRLGKVRLLMPEVQVRIAAATRVLNLEQGANGEPDFYPTMASGLGRGSPSGGRTG